MVHRQYTSPTLGFRVPIRFGYKASNPSLILHTVHVFSQLWTTPLQLINKCRLLPAAFQATLAGGSTPLGSESLYFRFGGSIPPKVSPSLKISGSQ